MASIWQATGGLAPHRRALAGVVVLLVVEAALPATTLLLLEQALRSVATGGMADTAWSVVGLFAVTAVAAGAKLLRTALSKGVAWRLAEQLRGAAHERLLQGAHPERTVGDRLSLLGQEIDQVQLGVSAAITLVRDPLSLLALAAAAVWVAPTLALATVAALVPVVLAVVGSTRWVARAARQQRDARAMLLSLGSEQLEAREVLEAHDALHSEGRRFRQAAAGDRQARWRLEVVRGVPGALTQTLGVAALGAVLLMGVSGIGGGQLAPGSVLAFAAGLFLALRPLSALAEAGSLVRRARAALERVEALLAGEGPPWTAVLRPTGAGLSLQDAALGKAVGPLTLEVPDGQWVALIGATGAGKTTVLRWWAGLSVPDAGQAVVHGVAPARVEPGERPAAYVAQDHRLFARSIEDNLRLGRPDADREVLHAVLADVCASELDLDQILAPGGVPLSGGERQRLALGRAQVLDRPIWLLDEPTAHLDAPTRDRLIDALRAGREGRTLVCATHDPVLAAQADRVVVLEAGQVVLDGPPHRVLPRRAGA